MSRHFNSIQEFSISRSASFTVRVIEVESTMQFTRTGVPYFRGILQDSTSYIRCTWWSMPAQHVVFQGLIGKCVTATRGQIVLARFPFNDLNRFTVNFDGNRGSEMELIVGPG